MTLIELIDEYKKMAGNCYNIDYADKKAVQLNNQSVKRMYQIINEIQAGFGNNGMIEFTKLLGISNDKVNLWAATHLLEKTQVDKKTEKISLAIIAEEVKDSLGYQYWLKSYRDRKKQ